MANQLCNPAPSSNDGQRNIIMAARNAFAERGFDGAKLRAISQEAGVLHTAMLYHFKSKDILWRTVVDDLFAELDARLAAHGAESAALLPQEFSRKLLRAFIRFSAERPELHRIMTSEGRAHSERLTWLVERHSRRMYVLMAQFTPLINMPAELNTPVRLYYAVIGLATAHFTLAPEFELLSGINPFAADELDRTVAFVEEIGRAHV